tara:strand:- start:411 stop:719 length:309 start_codon:yes stop_codon:yes gene_type:complete
MSDESLENRVAELEKAAYDNAAKLSMYRFLLMHLFYWDMGRKDDPLGAAQRFKEFSLNQMRVASLINVHPHLDANDFDQTTAVLDDFLSELAERLQADLDKE